MTALVRDIRDGLRAMAGKPAHTLAITVTLALGIGLNAAVFAVVDWVLLRPLPFPSPESLVRVRAGDGRERHSACWRCSWPSSACTDSRPVK
jgi:hypothetical protein